MKERIKKAIQEREKLGNSMQVSIEKRSVAFCSKGKPFLSKKNYLCLHSLESFSIVSIHSNSVTEIKKKAQIEEVLGDYLSLKQQGNNYWSRCPFHKEKTASFSISSDKGYYKCFGCGAKGDLFTFLMEKEGMGYVESLQHVAKKYQIKLQYTTNNNANSPHNKEKKVLLDLMSLAQQFYSDQLKKTFFVLNYLEKRAIPASLIQQFGIGYSSDQWDGLLKITIASNYSLAQLLMVGMIKEGHQNHYDRFRNRLMFPLHNRQGEIIGFAGRLLSKESKEAKYINPPEGKLYHKRSYLYGLHQALKAIRKNKHIYIVEGYMDVLAFHKADIPNVVAASGTSLSQEQLQIIAALTSSITLCFDGDKAGREASMRTIDSALPYHLEVAVVPFPLGKDPDQLLRQTDISSFQNYLQKKRLDWIDYLHQYAFSEEINHPQQMRLLTQRLLSSVALLPDRLQQALYLDRLTTLLSVEKSILVETLQPLLHKQSPLLPQITPLLMKENESIPASEQALLQMLLRYGHLPLPDQQSLAVYLFEEMEEIPFQNSLYEKIFQEFKKAWKNQEIEKGADFLQLPIAEQWKSIIIDLLDQPYSIAGWKDRKEASVPSEIDNLPAAAHKGVLYAKLQVIQALLKETTVALQGSQQLKQQQQLLEQHHLLKERMSAIAKSLGMVIAH